MTRRSKREIERRVDDLEDENRDGVGLIAVLSTLHNGGDVARVPGRRDLIQIDGEVKRLAPHAREPLAGWPTA